MPKNLEIKPIKKVERKKSSEGSPLGSPSDKGQNFLFDEIEAQQKKREKLGEGSGNEQIRDTGSHHSSDTLEKDNPEVKTIHGVIGKVYRDAGVLLSGNSEQFAFPTSVASEQIQKQTKLTENSGDTGRPRELQEINQVTQEIRQEIDNMGQSVHNMGQRVRNMRQEVNQGQQGMRQGADQLLQRINQGLQEMVEELQGLDDRLQMLNEEPRSIDEEVHNLLQDMSHPQKIMQGFHSIKEDAEGIKRYVDQELQETDQALQGMGQVLQGMGQHYKR